MKEILNQIDWQKVNGLIPAIIQNYANGRVLMLGYMDRKALEKTIETGQIIFFSRSRQKLWLKGETSGNFLNLESLSLDCDQDSLLISVLPIGPTCHTGSESCFEGAREFAPSFLADLEKIIMNRFEENSAKSYVATLSQKGLAKVAQKVGEEGVEIALAAISPSLEDFKNEAADLVFHLLILLKNKDVTLHEISQVLRKRHQ